MVYADMFLVNETYCLAIGENDFRNKMFALNLGLCFCIPSGVMIFTFIASVYVLYTSTVINDEITEDLFQSFHRIQKALFWGARFDFSNPHVRIV